jgi:hypothetical protein
MLQMRCGFRNRNISAPVAQRASAIVARRMIRGQT